MPAHFRYTPPAASANIGATRIPATVSVDFEPGPQRVLARVHGEIDMDHASALREDLTSALEAGRHGLDIDLSDVTFCDSSALHVLLDLNRMAAETGKSLVLTALSRRVSRLFEITGAHHVFTTVDGPRGAAASP
ncbi:STAS domain-containing protein [Streptomyces sp. NBC_01351]|uniref:STAS domain-containing protein n=1 Tax=Streptomyces sp. NBC_01351 TaxID=2903833 RepID=UPI002E36CEEC|nr:STAS domain-containing protein [Streptomyces sp. NBC_01351]